MCDIAPAPFGDGIVDVNDLIVLSEHLFEETDLVAHWKLDETEGDIAYDSIGVKDGILQGNPLWLPDQGMMGGALQLDGIDDYVRARFVLDPGEAIFSVFAWVKGGAPGQIIISQEDGADWLSADPSAGQLSTSLAPPIGRFLPPPPLVSDIVVADGDWHHVGFVWDGSDRILYVDNIEAARETQPSLKKANTSLYFGAGNVLDPGTFWSGLIDDVRIYDRAITP